MVAQAQIAAVSYLLAIVCVAYLPLKVDGEVLFADAQARWMAVVSMSIGAAITTTAIQCSVVGSCNTLAWIYTALLALGSIVVAVSAFQVSRQKKA